MEEMIQRAEDYLMYFQVKLGYLTPELFGHQVA